MNYNFNGTIQQNGQPISGGGKVYLHIINASMKFYIYTNSSTPFTETTFKQWLKNNGFINRYLYCIGSLSDITIMDGDQVHFKVPNGIKVNDAGTTITTFGMDYNFKTGNYSIYSPYYEFDTDTVIEM